MSDRTADPRRPRDRTEDLRHPRREGVRQDHRHGLRHHDGRRRAEGAAAAPAGRRVQRRGAGEVPRSSRRPAGAPPTTWRWRASSPSTSRTCTRPTRSPREALTDECEILVVGAGFAGLLLWYKLSQAGFVDVRFCEKGGDVGGTWYWNRYPGIACDVESYSYFPLLEEMGYVPTMKFASGFEIFEYCQKMAEKFGFYEHCLFHTTVETTEWDEDSRALDGVHRPRRRHAGPLRDPRQRHPHHARSWPASRAWRRSRASRSTRRAGTTTSTWTASGSASSAPAPPPCRPSPSWPRSPASCTCSSARRRRSTCATSGRRPTEEIEDVGQRAGLGARPPGPLRQDLRRAHRDPGQRRLPRRQGRRLQGAQAARTRADARGADRRSSSTRTSGSWSRSGRGSTPSSRTRRPPRR